MRKVRETSMVMRKKKRITLNEAERKGRDVLGRPEGGGLIIKSEVLGS